MRFIEVEKQKHNGCGTAIHHSQESNMFGECKVSWTRVVTKAHTYYLTLVDLIIVVGYLWKQKYVKTSLS